MTDQERARMTVAIFLDPYLVRALRAACALRGGWAHSDFPYLDAVHDCLDRIDPL
jgi:hypothetical protein